MNKIISFKETIEAKAWALNVPYAVYVERHNQEFVTPPMDPETYKEFFQLMDRAMERDCS